MLIEENAAPFRAAELEFQMIRHTAPVKINDDRPLFGLPEDELRILMRAVRMAERGIVDGFDDIRLALSIRTEENVDARLQCQVKLIIVPIISEL